MPLQPPAGVFFLPESASAPDPTLPDPSQYPLNPLQETATQGMGPPGLMGSAPLSRTGEPGGGQGGTGAMQVPQNMMGNFSNGKFGLEHGPGPENPYNQFPERVRSDSDYSHGALPCRPLSRTAAATMRIVCIGPYPASRPAFHPWLSR